MNETNKIKSVYPLSVRYRPQLLEEMIGQERALASLRGRLMDQSLPPSILISGDTGTGKNTLARIISQYKRCTDFDKEHMRPCFKCKNCGVHSEAVLIPTNKKYAVTGHVETNLAEKLRQKNIGKDVDAAQIAIPWDKDNVWVFDEAQYAEQEITNQILKAIETPEMGNIFIVLSSDYKRLGSAFISRCFHIRLEKPSNDAIIERLKGISKQEGFFDKISDLAFRLCAEMANGSVRQAIENLENVYMAMKGSPRFDINQKSDIEYYISDVQDQERQNINRFLFSGLYAGDLKKAIEEAILFEKQRILKDTLEEASSYHLQSFYLMVDPDRSSIGKKIEDNWFHMTQQLNKDDKNLLTVESAAQVMSLFTDLKAMKREQITREVLLGVVTKMWESVIKHQKRR